MAAVIAGDQSLNRCKIMSSELCPSKIEMFPLLLCGWGLSVWINLRNDAFHRSTSSIFPAASIADAGAAVACPDTWFKIVNPWLYTKEIVPSNEFKQMLMSLLESKGELIYPSLSVQGLQIDITSTQNSIPINSTGAWIEKTLITFMDWNSGQLPVTACGATKSATMENYYKSNQLLCGFAANITANEWGAKHLRFLPKI